MLKQRLHQVNYYEPGGTTLCAIELFCLSSHSIITYKNDAD